MAQPVVEYQETDPVTVASRLRHARESAGLSRREVAEATGIPMRSYEKIEYGQVEPNLSRLKVLCRYLDVPVQEILDEVEDGDAAPARARKGGAEDPQAEARQTLEQVAGQLGLKVVPAKRPSPPTDAENDDDAAAPKDAGSALNALADFAEDNGVNARGVTKVLRQARNALEAMDLGGLIDLADARGFDLDTLPARNEGDGKHATELVERLLIAALYEVDPMRLDPDALERLSVELAGGDPDNLFEGKSLIRGRRLFEDVDRFRQRAVAELQPHILKAVRRRAAPDLADDKRYPRSEPEGEE